jgi:hypothetical protein
MKRTVDLETALGFVIGRIVAEAIRSGEPLSDEEDLLVHHLPKEAAPPQTYATDPQFSTVIHSRDPAYERLCGLAKAARQIDLQLDTSSALDWEFAAAVSKLNRHPISWLLDWAGVKVRRTWWDGCLLLAFSLLLGFSGVGLAFVALIESWKPFAWAAVGSAFLAFVVLLFSVSRRIEMWQVNQRIEACRREPLGQRVLTVHPAFDDRVVT